MGGVGETNVPTVGGACNHIGVGVTCVRIWWRKVEPGPHGSITRMPVIAVE